jgi:hypothetical protein
VVSYSRSYEYNYFYDVFSVFRFNDVYKIIYLCKIYFYFRICYYNNYQFFVINKYFEVFNIKINEKNKIKKYFKIYFAILWRAVLILIPVIGFIAIKYKGSIESRIWTIIIEILAGFPAIWWYLSKLEKINFLKLLLHFY